MGRGATGDERRAAMGGRDRRRGGHVSGGSLGGGRQRAKPGERSGQTGEAGEKGRQRGWGRRPGTGEGGRERGTGEGGGERWEGMGESDEHLPNLNFIFSPSLLDQSCVHRV